MEKETALQLPTIRIWLEQTKVPIHIFLYRFLLRWVRSSCSQPKSYWKVPSSSTPWQLLHCPFTWGWRMDKIPIRQCSQFCFIILLFFPLRPNHHKREAHQRHDYSLQIIETMWIFIKIPQQTNIQHLMQPNSKYVLCVYVCVCGCVRVCVNYVCIRAKKRALNKFWWNFVNDLHLN